MEPTIRIFPDQDRMIEEFLREFFIIMEELFSAGGFRSIALSGGTTPRPLYRRLATASLHRQSFWREMLLFWGDERCVPPDHPESNFRLASETFLSHIEIPEANIHRIRGEAPSGEEVIRYGKEIRDLVPENELTGMPRFDWIFLGIGEDGHVASLFPGSGEIHEKESICVVARHPLTGQERISLSLPVINSARRITFFAVGERKAPILQRVIRQLPGSLDYPAGMVRPKNGLLEWYIDKDAARLL